MTGINVDINQLVSDVAQKLGIAVDKIYPMLYRQAMIDGVMKIFLLMFSIFVMYGCFKFWKCLNKEHDCLDETDVFYGAIFAALIGGFFLVVSSMAIKSIINIFMNPDWYIIRYVLDYIK